jgi:hypothetical protein
MSRLRKKEATAPRLIKVRANIFVANAVFGATWNCIMAGTVIKDVLPVTTLTALVRRKMQIKISRGAPVMVES